MSQQPDGWYDRTKPWNRPTPYSYSPPSGSNEERRVTEALASVTEPGVDLADIVRPPLSQVVAFRPRFGYRQRVLGIEDVIDIDREYQVQAEASNASPVNSWGSGTAW